ncbi:unnamed protein product [Clavelina lepadiformis]|uniref:C2H2-type domain-containing protein n=1 Tax=Clavelina lepadiformis TaxID=159417 RepID=A0ABP0FSL7_CLALP
MATVKDIIFINMASGQPSSKKIKYDQRFRAEWLQQKEFKDWLIGPTKTQRELRCSLCNREVMCHRSALVKHTKTQLHIRNVNSKKAVPAIADAFAKHLTQNIYKESTEVQIAAFIAEHNLPFTLANPLLSLMQSIVPTNPAEKGALSRVNLNATKCTNIVRQGVGLFAVRLCVHFDSFSLFQSYVQRRNMSLCCCCHNVLS